MKLLYFIPLNFQECCRKGNVTYLRNFEVFFKNSYILYFNSEVKGVKRIGRTIYVSTKICNNVYINVIFSPFVLFCMFRRINPDIMITTDCIYSFFSTIISRFFKTYFLQPVFIIEDMYHDSKCHFLPIKFLERLFIKLSLIAAPKILFPLHKKEPLLENNSYISKKLIKIKRSVEEFPTPEFILESKNNTKKPIIYENEKDGRIKAVTVSRLHTEKLLNEAIQAVAIIQKYGIDLDFYIFGDGPEKKRLEDLSLELGITEKIHFLGSVRNQDLVPYLKHADFYLSTLTGTALREAVLCGLPIVTYKNYMTEDYFKDGSIGYITDKNTPSYLADGIKWYLENSTQHESIKNNINKLKSLWVLKNLKQSLEEAFNLK